MMEEEKEFILTESQINEINHYLNSHATISIRALIKQLKRVENHKCEFCINKTNEGKFRYICESCYKEKIEPNLKSPDKKEVGELGSSSALHLKQGEKEE